MPVDYHLRAADQMENFTQEDRDFAESNKVIPVWTTIHTPYEEGTNVHFVKCFYVDSSNYHFLCSTGRSLTALEAEIWNYATARRFKEGFIDIPTGDTDISTVSLLRPICQTMGSYTMNELLKAASNLMPDDDAGHDFDYIPTDREYLFFGAKHFYDVMLQLRRWPAHKDMEDVIAICNQISTCVEHGQLIIGKWLLAEYFNEVRSRLSFYQKAWWDNPLPLRPICITPIMAEFIVRGGKPNE